MIGFSRYEEAVMVLQWPELVIFDNNGTLFDDLHLAYGSVQAIFSVLNVPCPTMDQYRNEIGANFMEFYWKHGAPKDVTGDQLNVIRKLYYRQRHGTAHYRSDCRGTIERLRQRGTYVAICSAEIEETLRAALAAEHLDELFAPGMIRGQAWPKKAPHLQELVRSLAVRSERAVYIDDTDDGIRAAHEAGIRAAGFCNPTGYNSEQRILGAEPDAVISQISETYDLAF